MWGFVSVMVALLFLFMPWTVVDGKWPPVDRAVALHATPLPGALREDAMQVDVTRDGRVFFRNHQVNAKDLPNEIREGIRAGAEKRIYLAADARVKYGDVRAVLDQIRLSGIEKVSFLTQEPYR